MLYRLIVQNFRSFRDRTELSMIPDDNSIHVANKDGKYPILRDVAIYGANASGKSNIIKTLDFLQEAVTDSSVIPLAKNQAFKLSEDTINDPSLFVVELWANDTLYQFGLVLHFKTCSILKEWLNYYDDEARGWKQVYSREMEENTTTTATTFCVSEDEPDYARFDIYRQDMVNLPQRLVLSEIASKNLTIQGCAMHIKTVYEWFKDLIVIFPHTNYNLIGALVEDMDGVNRLYRDYFHKFDIDIEEIKLKPVSLDAVTLPEKTLANIRHDLQTDNKNSLAMLHGSKDFVAQLDSNGELQLSEVKFVHKLNDYTAEFEISEESDGTRRLFDLIPMVGYLMNSKKVILIDEIDRSLHCLLTRRMLKMILEESEETCNQIILSTHDIMLMDLDILGRREIWFVDKKNKVSNLYPLDMYKFENDLDISNNYLLGRFKAIPNC